MTTQFTNIKHEVFASKEHYLAFRQAWKDFINSGKAKPYYEEDGFGGKVKVSNLDGSQHLLFCILTGKDLSLTFKPARLECKHGFDLALHSLWHYLDLARRVVKYEETGETPKYLKDYAKYAEKDIAYLTAYLEPFGKVFTPRMLVATFDGLDRKDIGNVVIETKEAA